MTSFFILLTLRERLFSLHCATKPSISFLYSILLLFEIPYSGVISKFVNGVRADVGHTVEVKDPVIKAGSRVQVSEFGDEFGWNYDIE
eukprot:g39988.t1